MNEGILKPFIIVRVSYDNGDSVTTQIRWDAQEAISRYLGRISESWDAVKGKEVLKLATKVEILNDGDDVLQCAELDAVDAECLCRSKEIMNMKKGYIHHVSDGQERGCYCYFVVVGKRIVGCCAHGWWTRTDNMESEKCAFANGARIFKSTAGVIVYRLYDDGRYYQDASCNVSDMRPFPFSFDDGKHDTILTR